MQRMACMQNSSVNNNNNNNNNNKAIIIMNFGKAQAITQLTVFGSNDLA